ncbi:thioesterase II family protein [Streptosporangium roseum]|uniref:thioesterase II family protein n=1 Tax=Streptosporangium roseum TaxID=2001 RepID=UPI00332A04D2
MSDAVRDPWLVEIVPGSDAGKDEVFYAVPHAGAGAAAVRDLCRVVGRYATTVAVRLPAREARLEEPPLREVAPIANAVAEAIIGHARGRKITMYGHCSGAIVAFETALRLQTAGVRALFLSAHQPPDRIVRDGVWRWPGEPFIQRVAADGYMPPYILEDPELLALIEPALRADYEAIETYRPSADARLDAPILGILGTADGAVDERDFAAWSGFTSCGFELHKVRDGGHNLLLSWTAEVAEVITGWSRWH